MILPLGGCDMVLGNQWLSTLGNILFNFKELKIEFKYEGRKAVLKGAKKPMLKWMEGTQLPVQTAELASMVLCVYPTTSLNMISAATTQGTPIPISNVLLNFEDVFAIPTTLPPLRAFDHKIALKEGTKLIYSKPYRHPPTQKDAIEVMVKELLESGVIKPSQSPFSSPMVMVKTKDGTWRMCVDYRRLNAQTIKDKFPIPIVEELIDELQGSNYFSKLDLRSGYHQIRMCQDDVEKTAFRTHEGHYEFLVMPFGLTNAPSTFQALMNFVFKKYLRKFMLVFFDDILVYSLDLESHIQHLTLVLQEIRSHALFAKKSKCVFGAKRVEYLGHVITSEGVATDQTKTEAMQQWPIPENLKQFRGFLDLTSYYRRFIKGYAFISNPLTKLMKKNAFNWSTEAQTAFIKLKEAVISAPVLKLPNFNAPFMVETNALGEGIEQRITTPAQMKWLPKLMGFDFEIVYKKGSDNEATDALSRVKTGGQLLQMVLTSECLLLLKGYKRSKPDLSSYPGLLQPLPIPTFICHFIALSHLFTAIQVAQVFLDNVYKLHGLPKLIVSDSDKIFLSLYWKELFKMLQVYLHFSTAYHPQIDGQTEVVNRCLEYYLRCMCGEKPKEYSKWLSLAEYWYNTNFHTAIRTTPFEVVYGQPPISPILYSPGQSNVDSVDRSLSAREAIVKMLQFHLEKAQERMKVAVDLHRTDRSFKKGQ
nr:retrotransposon-related protein [Tanacetum cinerariifolium]